MVNTVPAINNARSQKIFLRTISSSTMRYSLLLLLLLSVITGRLNAQIDQEFWFAPPDLTQGTPSEAFRDRPVQMVVSTINEPAQVTIWQPANLSFAPIVLTLGATATQSVNLTAWINQIETRIPDSVLNTGILIRSTAPITAYYELGAAANRDIMALKGKNANGTLFYTAFQTIYENDQSLGGTAYVPPPRSGFVIVATDDSTTVTITPRIAILNHAAGVPFSIYLHRGQTYYCEALDQTGPNRPAGTRIESDKPIAVTMKDDMIDIDLTTDGGADLACDQLISEDKCGFKHIVVKGELGATNDRVFVVALYDSTEIFIESNPIAVDTLMAGEQYIYTFTGEAGFIEGSKKISLLHISGVGDQVAGAIVPSLECTGSNQVGFTRPGSGNLRMTLTIKTGFENTFTLNGVAINPVDFQVVPGSNGEWVFLHRIFTTAEVPVGAASLVANFGAELFHMGITYQQGASCNYGYFSNFSYLNLGNNRELCLGDSAVLDAGPGKTSYIWKNGAGVVIDTTQKITVFDPGVYTVDVLSGNDCSASDTIEVSYYLPPVTIQASRDTICQGAQLLLTVPGTFLFQWQDNTTNPFYIVSDSGLYYVEVTDFQGCRARDSIRIWTSPRPATPVATILPFDPTVDADTVCSGVTVNLQMNALPEITSYSWFGPGNSLYSGETLALENITVAQSGDYLAFYTLDGCESFYDTVSIVVNQTPEVYIGLSDTVCNVSQILLDGGAGAGYTYEWQDGSTDQTFLAILENLYWVEVATPQGCVKRDSVNLVFSLSPDAPILSVMGADVLSDSVCAGTDVELSVPALSGAFYYWTNGTDTIQTGAGQYFVSDIDTAQSGNYYAYYVQNGCPSLSDSAFITVAATPEFEFSFSDSTLCEGGQVTLSAADVADVTYLWQDGTTTTATFTATTTGQYSVTLRNAAGCTLEDSVQINFNALPQSPAISGDPTLCEGEGLALQSNQQAGVEYLWTGPGVNISTPVLNITSPQPGLYQLTATLSGCKSSDTASVTVAINPLPQVTLGDDTGICQNATITLNGPDGMESYNWSNDETTQQIEVGPGTFTLTVTDANQCESSDVITIIQTGPVAAFSSDPATGAQTGIVISFTDNSEGNPVSWSWNFGDNQGAQTQNTTHAFSTEGEITVSLSIADANGCTDTASRVYVISNSVAVPNSFTPNGDGSNDLFVVKGLSAFPNSKLLIFNRWGNEVYTTQAYANNWDAVDYPDGVYFYILTLSNEQVINGPVTVKRN